MDSNNMRVLPGKKKAFLAALLTFCSINLIMLAYLIHEEGQNLGLKSLIVDQWYSDVADIYEAKLERQKYIAGLFLASVHVTETEFDSFARSDRDSRLYDQVLGWVPFSASEDSDARSASALAASAMKVQYLSGSSQFNILRDKDFNQLFPACAGLIEKMMISGKSAACIPHQSSLPPFMDQSYSDALLVTTPVSTIGKSEPIGMVFGIYALGHALLKAAPENDLGVYAHLFVRDNTGYRNVYRYGHHVANIDVPPRSLGHIKALQFHHISTLRVADLPLVFAFSTGARPLLLTDGFDWLAFFILLISIFGAVAAYYIIIAIQRRLVDQKIAQENADHLNQLINGSVDALVEIDTEGLVTTWSPAAERIFGWTEGEAKGRLLTGMIIPPEHREPHDIGLKHHLETGKTEILGRLMEFKALTKEGSLRDVEIFIEKVELGEHIYFAWFLRDVSERKLNESKSNALLENIPDMAWFKDVYGRFVAVNEAFCHAAGRTREELLGKTDCEIWPHDLAQDYINDDMKVIASKEVHEVTEMLYHCDGTKRWIDTIKRPVLDNYGNVIGTVGIGRDVTESQQNQAQLKALTLKLQAIFDAAPIGILFTKKDNLDQSVIIRCNRRVRELFGFAEDELVGLCPDVLFAIEEEFEQFSKGFSHMPLEENITLEARLKRKNGGSLFWGRLTGRPLVGDRPENGYVWLIDDVTNERDTQEHLIRAQRMEVIGQLTGGLAHDFNNLLGIIVANLDLAREMLGDDSTINNFMDVALEASLRGAGLTKKLMSIARKQNLSPVEVDINQTLTEMQNLLRASTGRGIAFEMSLVDGNTTCMLDVSGFETAVINLVINARDALLETSRTDGVIRITTSIVNFDEGDYFFGRMTPGPYVSIRVSDNGPGMSKEVLGSAMEAFFTTKPLGSGTGLGLPMVQSFVDHAKGGIKLYSEEGFGTTVSISVPTCDGDLGKSEPMWKTDDFKGTGRILLVEDEEALLLATSTWLQSLGYEVVAAVCGEDALELLRAPGAHFDLLLTDVVMPGEVNGIQLAKKAKKHDPKMQVIYMSGFTGLVASETIFTPENLLIKPFRKRDLGKIIKINFNSNGVKNDVLEK